MSARTHTDRVYKALSAAFRRLVKDAGGLEAATTVTRADINRLSQYGNANKVMQAPIDVVADLQSDTDTQHVTRVLADLGGFILVKKPDARGDAQWSKELGKLAKEAGEAMTGLGEAVLNDGQVTADEIHDLDLRKQVRDVLEVAAHIDATLARIEATTDVQGGE
jgi:hypothetical protein